MTIKELEIKLKNDASYKKLLALDEEDAAGAAELLGKLRKKYLKTEYVPYITKVAICQKIVEYTSRKEINGQSMIVMNTPLRSQLYFLNLIDSYTVIDVDYSKGTEIFDEIQQNDEAEFLLALIPDSEVSVFRGLLDMCVEDFETNNLSLPSYLDTKLGALSLSGEAILSTLEQLATKLPKDETKVDAE